MYLNKIIQLLISIFQQMTSHNFSLTDECDIYIAESSDVQIIKYRL